MAKKLYDEEGNVVKGAKVKKPFYKKWWFIALVVVLVIGAFSGGDDEGASDVADDAGTADVVEDVDASEPKDENEPGEVEEEPVEKTYSVGDLVNVGTVSYLVNGIDTATNIGGEYGQNSKGTYLLVNVTVTNNGDEALTVDNSLFKLLNDGKEYDSDSAAGIYANDDSSFFLESVNPELSLTGNVVFDVSDTVIDSSTKQLKVATGFWGTETEVINLQ